MLFTLGATIRSCSLDKCVGSVFYNFKFGCVYSSECQAGGNETGGWGGDSKKGACEAGRCDAGCAVRASLTSLILTGWTFPCLRRVGKEFVKVEQLKEALAQLMATPVAPWPA